MTAGLEQDFSTLDVSCIHKLRGSNVFGPHLPEVLGKVLIPPKNLRDHEVILFELSSKRRLSNHNITRIADRSKNFLHRIQK